MKKITALLVFGDIGGHWETEAVEVPEEVAESESQDVFLEWVYSDGGKQFRDSWADAEACFGDLLAVFRMEWRAQSAVRRRSV
jgi:hypothetical protein